MRAENHESAAPEGVELPGTTGVQDRLGPLRDKGRTSFGPEGVRNTSATNPFVEEGLSNLRGCWVGKGDEFYPALMMIDDDTDVFVVPAARVQGPEKVNGYKFERGAYRCGHQYLQARRAAVSETPKWPPQIAEVVRLNSATAENLWKDDEREGVTYANIHKVMEHTELQRRVPQAAGRSGAGGFVFGVCKADLNVRLVVGAAGRRLGRRGGGADCRTQVAQTVPQKAHSPVRSVGHMVDCSAQGSAPQLGGAGGRRVRGANVQNCTGGKLVQDERPLRGNWRKGCRSRHVSARRLGVRWQSICARGLRASVRRMRRHAHPLVKLQEDDAEAVAGAVAIKLEAARVTMGARGQVRWGEPFAVCARRCRRQASK
ncbi:hypothetical protein Emag_007503 [Eimeria magna]